MSNRLASALRQMGPKLLIRSVILIALLIGAGVLVNQYQFEDIIESFGFASGNNAGWLNGRVAFFCLAALFTASGGPRQVISFFAAYFFGLLPGFFIASGATLAGCAIALTAARIFGGTARKLVRGRVDIALQIWAKNALEITLLLRLLPVGSNLVTNVTAGVAGIPVVGFLLGSALGYAPQTMVFALMGSGVNIGSNTQIIVSIALFVVSAILGVWIYARYRKSIRSTGQSTI
ncbi:MAG: TVP38/TMEM64 family protein [Rhizobiaceae bacterium]